MKRNIVLGLFILFYIGGYAQCPLKSPDFPISTYDGYNYTWSAGLYSISQVGGAQTITTLTFRLDNPSYASETFSNQYIYFRHSSTSNYTSSSSYPGTSGFTLVWSGTISISGDGFYNITLATPFAYNGTDNLEVLWENKSNHYPSDVLEFDRTDASATLYNGKWGDGYSWSNATSHCIERPFNTAFGFNTTNTVNCNDFETSLPIELSSFSAKQQNAAIVLGWTTNSETNNDYFTIEHSVDGLNFTKISFLNGAGNSNKIIKYSFKDNNPDNNINYYRLKQTDFDGNYSYSKILAINFNKNQLKVLHIYPNPVDGSSFTVETQGNDISEIHLFNNLGEEISVPITYHQTNYLIDVSQLPKGLYFVKTTTDNQTRFDKVLKM